MAKFVSIYSGDERVGINVEQIAYVKEAQYTKHCTIVFSTGVHLSIGKTLKEVMEAVASAADRQYW